MGQLGHLVQEDRAAVGLLEIALAGIDRAGERPLFVSEELGIDRPLGDGAAIDGDILIVLAGRAGMNHLWKKLLAHAALARNEHRQIGGCDPDRHLQRTVERRGVSDDPETVFYGG
jgi:hypothetical protein